MDSYLLFNLCCTLYLSTDAWMLIFWHMRWRLSRSQLERFA
jgi:hypothetical protein